MSENKNEIVLFEKLNKEDVKRKIYEIRGKKVMLDSDIAMYFGVTTGNLNKAKNRNKERFPENFSFVLTKEEISVFQNGISMQTKGVKGGRSNSPTVYTEQGVAMLTSVLHTPRAISASIQIMEAFVEMSHTVSQGIEPFINHVNPGIIISYLAAVVIGGGCIRLTRCGLLLLIFTSFVIQCESFLPHIVGCKLCVF
jgi:hypothetical protein